MSKPYFLLFLLLSAAGRGACSHEQEREPPQEAAAGQPAGSVPAATVAEPAAAVSAVPRPETVYAQLQGKWQSTTDEKDVVEFRGHSYIDYYDQELLSTKAFILDQACPGATEAGHPGDDARYLVVEAEDMCWQITGLDQASLELEYTAGGKTLNYTRLQ